MPSESQKHSLPSQSKDSRLRIAVLLAHHFTLNAFALFVDTLRLASDEQDRSGRKYIDWTVLNDTGQLIRSSSGVEVAPTARIHERLEFDYVAVVGGRLNVDRQLSHDMMDYLKRSAARGTPVIGLCTGSFVLAEAGLLTGKTACVSWLHREDFQQAYPDIAVVSHRLFLEDGNIMTCAGGTAVADLAAFVVKKHIGLEAAKNAMEILQLDRYRSGSDMQSRLPQSYQSARDERVKRALLLMEQAVGQKCDIGLIARSVGVSSRQLERLFKQDIGTTPVGVFQAIRLDKAKFHVQHSTQSIMRLALDVGYESQTHFSRAFKNRFGLNPSVMRQNSLKPPET